ncbi:MAG: ADP-ribosylglycohydrolase family protein [Deltaproteobacteria bacterium]|nr:ADP-ribosylglycohydrolase family protein [Deltaproteobacteria bacterium]
MAHPVSRDQAQGSLIGMALGNSLGFLVSGEPPKYCADFARHALTDTEPPWLEKDDFAFGQYVIDVQLARELGLSLVEAHGFDPTLFAARLAELFRSGGAIAAGKATTRAAKRLVSGMVWAQAGEPAPAAGNGAAVRAVPIGLSFKDARKRTGAAEMQASVTHHDERAQAAAVLVAESVFIAATQRNTPRQAVLEHFAAVIDTSDTRLSNGLRTLERALALPPEKAAVHLSAAGFVAGDGFPQTTTISPFSTPSILFGLYAFLRSPDEPAEVLEAALSGGGDTASIGAFAGALLGARLGLSGLGEPLTSWSAQLGDRGEHGRDALLALGAALVDRRKKR